MRKRKREVRFEGCRFVSPCQPRTHCDADESDFGFRGKKETYFWGFLHDSTLGRDALYSYSPLNALQKEGSEGLEGFF